MAPFAPSTEIAVIGAGVIGLAIAQRLAAEGREVTLIDPAPPGSGASHGNAGTIADYAVHPVGTPGVLKALPSLLLNPTSPLAIRRDALTSLAPWLLRFAAQCLPGPARRNATALASLLSDACPRWESLAAEIGGADLLRRKGCLYLYETAAQFRNAGADLAQRRGLGVTVDLLSPGELVTLEPGLPEMEGGAAHFGRAIFLSDPGEMVQRLARALQPMARVLQARVTALARQTGGVQLNLARPDGTSATLIARRVVLAAGAHSRALAAQAGDPVPLETERGYHVEWDMGTARLTRPACPTARGFYLCPMEGRLRVAGTVELGGLTKPPSPHRIAKLIEGARAIFPDLPETPDRTWMGFRPSMPDSLPVIGPSRSGADIIHAFGHGHIGLTLAPVTAELVADLIAARPPRHDLAPVSPRRF